MREERLILNDGHDLFYRVWEAEGPVATVHINHGMAEHSLRYDGFAKVLVEAGYTVYAQDHRGHGFTKQEDETGWFADEDGWKIVINDAFQLDQKIAGDHPGLPHFVFGHSMGSFITRNCISCFPEAYDAAVICGTGASQGIVGKAGKMLGRMHSKKNGGRLADQMLTNLSFGPYDKHFKGEGKNAWLSRDPAVRDEYNEDPLCGFTCSSRFFVDLIELIEHANSRDEIAKVDKDLDILIISGGDDPVGGYGAGIRKVYGLYQDAGIRNVQMKLYEGARHEILNETNRKEVYSDVLGFFRGVMKDH